jgi:hypothetical protein
VLTVAGISTETSFEHPLNALFPIEVKADGAAKASVVKPLQPEKALLPMEVTEAGMSRVTILEHRSNASIPIVVNPEGDVKLTAARLLQTLKEYSSRVVTEPGSVMANNPEQPLNAYFATEASDVGKITVFNVVFPTKFPG